MHTHTHSPSHSLSRSRPSSPARQWLYPHAQPAVITVSVCMCVYVCDVRRDSSRSSLSSSPASNHTLSSDTHTSNLHSAPDQNTSIPSDSVIYCVLAHIPTHEFLLWQTEKPCLKYCLEKEMARRSSIELPCSDVLLGFWLCAVLN